MLLSATDQLERFRKAFKMSSQEQRSNGYAEFLEIVKRTIYIDNLSPQVTVSVITTALSQFANVKKVEFVPNYTVPYPIPKSALVEVESEREARNVMDDLSSFPFMMSGMPRPVRAKLAKAEMFADRPAPPDRKIQVKWLTPSDPGFDVTNKMKDLYHRHNAEHLALIKHQLEEEEDLAKQQDATLKGNYKKYEMIESVMQDGTFRRLARHYSINLVND